MGINVLPRNFVGNPLTLVDPSGFQPAAGVVSQPGFPDAPLAYEEIKAGAGSQLARYLTHEGPPPREEPPPKEKEDARQAGEVGAAAPPTDVDTTGSSQEIDAQAATTAPEDWTQNPYVQLEGGFLAGVSLGLVPFGGVGQQLADAGELLPHGTSPNKPEAFKDEARRIEQMGGPRNPQNYNKIESPGKRLLEEGE
jgi:hypothetical protein